MVKEYNTLYSPLVENIIVLKLTFHISQPFTISALPNLLP